MDGARVLDEIRRDPRYRDQIVHEETFPARPARYADPAWPLPAPLADALRADQNVRLTTAVSALGPTLVAAAPEEIVNINSPDDLRRAESRLAQPNVKS